MPPAEADARDKSPAATDLQRGLRPADSSNGGRIRSSDFYKVSADIDQREATSVLQLMAKKNLKDIFYHARNLAISHYYAEKGERRNKDRVIAENLTIKDAAGWERICPKWCQNKKDGWSALVRYWTEDEDFKAKSIQNKANRGTGGTHNQGNKPFPVYEKDMAAHKKKDLVGGEVAYYGKVTESVKKYTEAFKKLHGEDSDPLSQPLDETAVMISGVGKPHGRTSILNAVHKPTITLPRIRHITSSSGMCMPPRPWHSTQTSDDARWEETYEQLHAEFQQKMQEYEEAATAARRHESEQTKALFLAMRTGAQPPEYVEPPVVPPMPRLPSKTEFLAQLYGRTPVSALPYY
ncbi:hypothetical protein ACQ4PT_067408 [Festuca glaucescens]